MVVLGVVVVVVVVAVDANADDDELRVDGMLVVVVGVVVVAVVVVGGLVESLTVDAVLRFMPCRNRCNIVCVCVVWWFPFVRLRSFVGSILDDCEWSARRRLRSNHSCHVDGRNDSYATARDESASGVCEKNHH